MEEGAFGFGFIFGFLLAIFIGVSSWHIEESLCQNKHNVADCVYSRDAFIPAPVE